MPAVRDRIAILLDEQLEDLPSIRQRVEDTAHDKNGSSSNLAASALRFIAVAQFFLTNDIASFRRNLKEAAMIKFNLIQRFDRGESISSSYVTMLNYKTIFNALAACDHDLARAVASAIGHRHELERDNDHPFDYAFGYTLRSFVLREEPEMRRWSDKFRNLCKHKENIDFRGYSHVFDAILAKDEAAVCEGLKLISNGHQKQSKGKGVFKDSEDEVLCVWGIGVGNLAKSFGLAPKAQPPLIPEELLC